MPLSLYQRDPALGRRLNEAFKKSAEAAAQEAARLGRLALTASLVEQASSDEGPLMRNLEHFRVALESHRTVFTRIRGLPVPTPNTLAAKGVDFEKLGSTYERMAAEGLEPRIVMAPYIGKQEWGWIYRSLVKDKALNPGQRFLQREGVDLTMIKDDKWDQINVPPVDVPRAGADDEPWTIRIISKHNLFGVGTSYDNADYRNTYPTAAEFLTLIATTLSMGEEMPEGHFSTTPNDSTSWIYGIFEEQTRSGEIKTCYPYASWCQAAGRVDIRYTNVSDVHTSGVRTAAWEG